MRKFEGVDRDMNLLDTLKAEGSGILNWMISGCLMWRMQGLNPPVCVTTATAEYEAESDPLNEFVTLRCEEAPTFSTLASELFTAYKSWNDGTSHADTPLSLKAFGNWMRKRYRRDHTRHGNVYWGVRLRG
jgi:putative DNA primase/helicase